MARGRKPKIETEEVVTEAVEQPIEVKDEVTGGVADIAVNVVNEEIIEEPTPIEEEISSEPTADDVVDTPVEEKPKRQRRRRETTSETKDKETNNETTEESKAEFNPDAPLPEDSIRTKITVKNFTTIYRDENLTYPYARIYGDAILVDFVSTKVLKVKAMFNGRLVIGYIGRGSVN